MTRGDKVKAKGFKNLNFGFYKKRQGFNPCLEIVFNNLYIFRIGCIFSVKFIHIYFFTNLSRNR
ncbi:hypothetical protein, partial [Brachyspira aalborgi]|uniref:hypothetical protein n=1 Tax=Brachyspira aalborgi TaxID=29522 RepID=UPI001A7EF01B